jgi:hypothetical protein
VSEFCHPSYLMLHLLYLVFARSKEHVDGGVDEADEKARILKRMETLGCWERTEGDQIVQHRLSLFLPCQQFVSAYSKRRVLFR